MSHTPPALSIRAPRFPEEFASVAALLTASTPEWPVTAELLAYEHETRDPALFYTDRVAEAGGDLQGVLGVGHDGFSFEDWRYWATLKVRPAARNRGVGAALSTELLGILQEREAREVRTMLKETEEAGRRFLAARGWQETWRRHEFRIDTGTADLGAPTDLGGLRLESLEALSADPRRDERLYELDWTLFQDVPMGLTLTKRSLETWLNQELQDPSMRLGLSFALLDDTQNDPLHGAYVGYTTIMQNPGGFYVIGMTGVKREYRGRGLARALKLASMQAMRRSGGGEIRTFNDPPNAAMIAMNRALGFVQQPDHLRYELQLDPGPAAPGRDG